MRFLPGAPLARGAVLILTLALSGCIGPFSPSGTVKDLDVDGLFAPIDDAIERDADRTDARYDPQLGYPLEIAIDFSERMADEEVTYFASDLTPIR